jgi:cyclic beta-1,2-glucan synthetase
MATNCASRRSTVPVAIRRTRRRPFPVHPSLLRRAAIESIFGLQLRAHELSFAPCLPSHWQRAELTLRRDGRTLRFVLVRAGEQAALAATAPLGARLLRRSEALRWPELAADACFVVPLQGDEVPAPARAEAATQP